MRSINHKKYHRDGSVTLTTGVGGFYRTQTFTAEEWAENQKWKGVAVAGIALFIGVPFVYILCYAFGSIVPAIVAAPFLLFAVQCVYDAFAYSSTELRKEKEDE